MREKPVPGASMKTRSETSSKLWSLSITLYGAGVWRESAVSTRTGPNAPMRSHTVEEPGPPLNRKVIGRPAAGTPCLK